MPIDINSLSFFLLWIQYIIDVSKKYATGLNQKTSVIKNLNYKHFFKRLYLVKTTRWQHRFFDLASLSPMWLGTYEYMKNTLQNFFFRFETGLPEWIFQIWSKIVKSDRVFVYMKKSLFWAFWGPAKVNRPLVITKAGAGSEKTPKNWIGCSGRPKMRGMNFWPVLRRNHKNFGFYWPNHGRQIFVVQKPNLTVFGLFEVFLNDKRAFGLVRLP